MASEKQQHFNHTSGENDPVWVCLEPYSNRPKFSSLTQDVECDVCIIGSGIAGVSTAYELVVRGKKVVMLEAREVVSGESGRTSGHLTSDLDDGYKAIASKHGQSGAKAAAESHSWAIDRIEEIVNKLGIECEYRRLPAYELSQYPRGHPKHEEEIAQLKEEGDEASRLGLRAAFIEGLDIKGWDGAVDQRDGIVFENQATFHPTKYIVGVLKWLRDQPNFSCYTYTRMMSIEEHNIARALGMAPPPVEIRTQAGHIVKSQYAVEATCVPLQKLSIIAEMEYDRTYCIAVRVPKGTIEDCLIYDQAEQYKYARLTRCNDEESYLVVGGCDHKVGLESAEGRFEELERWIRERFTCAGRVDYRWSGQIYEPFDYMAFIGKNQGMHRTFVITGDSGDGLTHGVLGGRLIADEIDGVDNPWASLYSPSRLSIMKSLGAMASHDIQINTQYKRFLQTDIRDIEDLLPGTGGILNPKTSKPLAIYRDENGHFEKFSALCPHMKGILCWNNAEKTFDCPVHGSRFSSDGICVNGPAKAGLSPAET